MLLPRDRCSRRYTLAVTKEYKLAAGTLCYAEAALWIRGSSDVHTKMESPGEESWERQEMTNPVHAYLVYFNRETR